MPLNLPKKAIEIDRKIKADIQRSAPNSNPQLKNSWLSALSTAQANRILDFYFQLEEEAKEANPLTAVRLLESWASVWGITRLAATQATGNVIATGTATTSIPVGTIFTSSDGLLYESTASVVIASSSISVLSITRTGATATVTTISNHNLSSNVNPTIAGADQSAYNVASADITITGLNTFTYQVAGSPPSPATGTIAVSFTSASVPVKSQGFGQTQNQGLDSILTLQSPIVGVDNSAGVDFGEIGGGADQETNDQLRVRLLGRVQNPLSLFSVSHITATAKEIAGVTRVFVQETTPSEGQVTVYFMRDNDINPIPTSSEVATVKSKLLTIKPAVVADVDVIVSAPTALPIDFTFSAISPNTATMQAAIKANLDQFFSEQTSVGENITADQYRSAIQNTIDTETGDKLSTFTLSTPTTDISIGDGVIGTLGTVSF